ncbi:MAG: family intrarane metalloprotease [Mycobacterium sp.]|jgi:membrane protease YdiL (CAAX protease family)|nr:family intrarane metalloprotease [Mycobacterium sp.]
MTEPDTRQRSGLLAEIRDVVTTVAVPYQEPPAVVLRRRIVVAMVLVIGAVVLGYSLNTPPGTVAFYWMTVLLAAVWFTGAFLARPIHLGSIRWRGRNQRPVITGTVIGLLLGGLFLLGGLIAREIPAVADLIRRVLEYEHRGTLALVVIITLVNGAAEECFFRGAVYAALGRHHPVLISTVVYIAVTAASGNPMLSFAAIILGTVCALERRATGGVLAPLLTHLVWSLIMVLALPPMFGL